MWPAFFKKGLTWTILNNIWILSIQMCPFLCWGSGPCSNTWFLGPTRVHTPKGTSIGSSAFVGLTVVTHRHIHRSRNTGNSKPHHTLYYLYFFSQRVINKWNNLSQEDVDAQYINCFKNRLEKRRTQQMDFFKDLQSTSAIGCKKGQTRTCASRWNVYARCSR